MSEAPLDLVPEPEERAVPAYGAPPRPAPRPAPGPPPSPLLPPHTPPPHTPPPARGPARPPRWRRALRYMERCLAFAGAVLIVYHLGFGVSEMTSGSMSPTLLGSVAGCASNDWILYEKLSPGPPPRGRLIVFRSEDGITIVKRVVAFPGERVRVDSFRCLVDDVPLEAPAGVRYYPGGNLRPTPQGNQSFQVEPGTVYVLGDDSSDSWDSRWFGGLGQEQWRGRVVAIVWPPARWRWLW